MIREDYIMRMIQQIGVLVARILNQSLSHEEMDVEFEGLTVQWTGLPASMLLALSKEKVYSLFEESERMVVEKSYLMAEIYRAKGLSSESAESKREFLGNAKFFYGKCTGLVDESLQNEIDSRLAEVNASIDDEIG